MTVNPYTLNQLYQKGILDYVPTELYYPAQFRGIENLQNPYIKAAQEGNLYHQYGSQNDSFSYSNSVNGYNTEIGSQDNTSKMFYDKKVGTHNKRGFLSMFGFNGEGTSSQEYNTYSANGVGEKSNSNIATIFGGFSDASRSVSEGVNTVAGLHPIIKGLIALPILAATLLFAFRTKKKPNNTVKQGFFAKLNPFKKTEKTQVKIAKPSFWSRLTGKKSK